MAPTANRSNMNPAYPAPGAGRVFLRPRDTSYQTKDRNETEQKNKVAIQRDALLGCLAFWQRIHYV